VPDSFVPGNPYSKWISIGLLSIYLAATDISGAKNDADSFILSAS
jgi:hypothetical protein